MCLFVAQVKDLRNFKIKYLIRKELGLKSSKTNPQTLFRIGPQLLL